jgi:hypothetical protein
MESVCGGRSACLARFDQFGCWSPDGALIARCALADSRGHVATFQTAMYQRLQRGLQQAGLMLRDLRIPGSKTRSQYGL